MKKLYLKTIILIIILSISLIACNPNVNPMTGNPSEIFSNNSNNQDDKSNLSNVSMIAEGDIIKTYKNFIITMNSTSILIIKTENGNMSLIADYTFYNETTKNIIIHNDLLVSICERWKETQNEDDLTITTCCTEIIAFDLSALNSEEEYAFPILRELNLEGSYEVGKIFDNNLYVVSSFKSRELYINDERAKINDNGTEILLETTTFLNQYSNDFSIIACMPLNNIQKATNALSFYGNIFELCLFTTAVYPIFKLSDRTSFIIKLSLEELEYLGDIYNQEFLINNRYCINDNGNNLMVVTTNYQLGSRLTIYNNSLEEISCIDNIRPNENLKAVQYNNNFCYLTTFNETTHIYKIDISVPEDPHIVDTITMEGYNTYLHFIDELNLGIGIGYGQTFDPRICIYDTSDINIEFIDSRETSLLICSFMAAYDPRYIVIDRTKNLIILTGLGYSKFVASIIDEGGDNNYDDSWYFNIVIFHYSQEQIEIQNSVSYFLSENLSFLFNENNKSELELYTSRILVLEDYLYLISDSFIISFDMNDNYKKIDELNIVL